MTDQATPRRATEIPGWTAGFDPSDTAFIEWTCPACDRVAGFSVIGGKPTHMETRLRYGAIRRPEADEGGVPFYGPSSHWMRKHSERRSDADLALALLHRNYVSPMDMDLGRGVRTRDDYQAIFHRLFDGLCTYTDSVTACPRRLRFDLSMHMAPPP